MASLGVVIMLAGSFFGVLTYAAPLVASIFLIPVLFEFGKGAALLAYAVTAAVTVLVSPDKELAFFYVFIGFYPVLREVIGRLRSRLLRIFLKLVFFTAAVAALYLLLIFVFRLSAVVEEIGRNGLTLFLIMDGVLILILMLYDVGLGTARRLYGEKLRPKIGFLK